MDQIRWENNELNQKFEEAGEEIETLSNEVKNLQRQVEVKDETIENLKKNINYFASEGKKSGVVYSLHRLAASSSQT